MTQSKYDHHSAAATTIPSRAAAILAASSGSPAAPTPIATIDSPRAMMMISPWRSTKCSGETRHPRPRPISAPEVVDRQRGDPQRELGGPSKKPATTSNDGPMHGAGREPEDGAQAAPGRRAPAIAYSTRWSARTKKYATPKTTPRRRTPRAPRATTISIAAVEANIARRTAPSSGFERVRQPGVGRPRPPQGGRAGARCEQAAPGRVRGEEPVTWVMAKTKTRSKNSSSGVTRCSDSAGRPLCAGPLIWRSVPQVDQRQAGAAERLVQLGAMPDVVREHALDD